MWHKIRFNLLILLKNSFYNIAFATYQLSYMISSTNYWYSFQPQFIKLHYIYFSFVIFKLKNNYLQNWHYKLNSHVLDLQIIQRGYEYSRNSLIFGDFKWALYQNPPSRSALELLESQVQDGYDPIPNSVLLHIYFDGF